MRTRLNKAGCLLARVRKERGLTQTDVGVAMGVQKAMVSKIETGASVNVAAIEKMADALGVTPVVEFVPARKPGKDLIDYVMIAIAEFARRYGISVREASNYLNRYKGIDFISEFYDVEHTLSFNDCVDDLTVVCRNNGGGL